MPHYIFWWCMPDKAMSAVFEELAKISECSVDIIFEQDISEQRLMLGWEPPHFYKARVSFLPDVDWQKDVNEIINKYSSPDNVHIFCGIYAFKKVRFALKCAMQRKLVIGIISEAPINFFEGSKWIAKEFYIRYILPLRHKRIAHSAKFLFSASGDKTIEFVKLGWDSRNVFPFGYFPAKPSQVINNKNNISNKTDTHSLLKILCIGYLIRWKRIDVLLRALQKVSAQGGKYHCIITGFGNEHAVLEKLSKQLDIVESVSFTGVLSSSELEKILSQADVLVASGSYEAWGIRINEALQRGLPVIASYGIGASALVEASGAGVIFRPGDHNDLAKKLLHFINNPSAFVEAKQKALQFSQKLEPHIAAKYFHESVQYILTTSGNRPIPIWLP